MYSVRIYGKITGMKVKREYHGIPFETIAAYLVELGGARIIEHFFRGEGWSAALARGEPFPIGALHLETVQVDFEGEERALSRLLASFDLRMIRAGG